MIRMQNEYDLQDVEKFQIDRHSWLQSLLVIAGDTEKKEEVIHLVAHQSGLPLQTVELILARVIRVLINDTRSN
jgi:hypothetical protein